MLSERETRAALEAYICLYPNRVRFGGVTVLRSDEAPLSPMLNRIVGLGLDEPATEETVDAALEVRCVELYDPVARAVRVRHCLDVTSLARGSRK